MHKRDITGLIFGRLTALTGSSVNGRFIWKCSCVCGNTKEVKLYHLVKGSVRSCGCLQREKRITHDLSKSREYQTWVNIKSRCNDQKHPLYKFYGARGISICDEWLSFERFYADMGPRPVGTTIERVDNNSGYLKSNCVWATRKQQYRNRRNNVFLEAFGLIKIQKDWAEEIGMSGPGMVAAIRKGETLEQLINRKNPELAIKFGIGAT